MPSNGVPSFSLVTCPVMVPILSNGIGFLVGQIVGLEAGVAVAVLVGLTIVAVAVLVGLTIVAVAVLVGLTIVAVAVLVGLTIGAVAVLVGQSIAVAVAGIVSVGTATVGVTKDLGQPSAGAGMMSSGCPSCPFKSPSYATVISTNGLVSLPVA